MSRAQPPNTNGDLNIWALGGIGGASPAFQPQLWTGISSGIIIDLLSGFNSSSKQFNLQNKVCHYWILVPTHSFNTHSIRTHVFYFESANFTKTVNFVIQCVALNRIFSTILLLIWLFFKFPISGSRWTLRLHLLTVAPSTVQRRSLQTNSGSSTGDSSRYFFAIFTEEFCWFRKKYLLIKTFIYTKKTIALYTLVHIKGWHSILLYTLAQSVNCVY